MAEAPVVEAPVWYAHVNEIQPTVESWAAAWSGQDVDSYIAHYAPYFEPADLSRSAWETQRRTRLTRPARIAVRIEDLRRVGSRKGLLGGRNYEFVKVQFRQYYESNTYSDVVDKTLELEFLDGEWKIAVETVL